jgi:hypothetical protein
MSPAISWNAGKPAAIGQLSRIAMKTNDLVVLIKPDQEIT